MRRVTPVLFRDDACLFVTVDHLWALGGVDYVQVIMDAPPNEGFDVARLTGRVTPGKCSASPEEEPQEQAQTDTLALLASVLANFTSCWPSLPSRQAETRPRSQRSEG